MAIGSVATTLETYSSLQVGHVSFTFYISATNKSGSGRGSGTFTITTRGFCTGTHTFPCTFQIAGATIILGNLTVFIGTPLPSTYMLPLFRTGGLAGADTATKNPGPFLAVYPNDLNVGSLLVTEIGHLSGGFNYSYNIVQPSQLSHCQRAGLALVPNDYG